MDEIAKMKKMKYILKKFHVNRYINSPLFPLSQISYISSQICCCIFLYLVNNYDICCWQLNFLKIWDNYHEKSYITSKQLIISLRVSNIPIIKMFFSSYGILLFL